MTSTSLVAIAAAALSLIFSYLPGLNTWYAGKSDTFKKLFQVLWLAIVTLGVFGVGCVPAFASKLPFPPVACTTAGALDLAYLFIVAIVTNQATFLISPKAGAVKIVKAFNARLDALAK